MRDLSVSAIQDARRHWYEFSDTLTAMGVPHGREWALTDALDALADERAALMRRALILAEYCDDGARCSSHEVRAVAQAIRAQRDTPQEAQRLD